ncbi:hypothetical protein CsatB_016179 [Cannabis sativa]
MAGLQYNFFPTDFFYPRPASTSTATAEPLPTSVVQIRRPDVITTDDINIPSTADGRHHLSLQQLKRINKSSIIIPINRNHKGSADSISVSRST